MSLVLTSQLQKCLPALTPTVSPQNWEKIIADFIGQKQNETTTLIGRLVQNIQILEHQKEKATALIHILEEGGGLTVRARNMMTTAEDLIKYAPKIKELEDWFNLIRAKFDKTALESGTDGVNLMNGERLETLFDTKGQNKLVTEGIVLSCEALGIREPHFVDLYSLQNARIDVMNAIDIAVTVRNTIAAHITTLSISQDFALQAIELAKTSYSKLGTSNLETEMTALIKLGTLGDKILGDEKLADPVQQEILNSFASSPLLGPIMEEI
jgi:hypothetical protein